MLGAFNWWLYAASFNWQATKGYKHIQRTVSRSPLMRRCCLAGRVAYPATTGPATACETLGLQSPSTAVQQTADAGRPTRPPISGLLQLAIQHSASRSQHAASAASKNAKALQCNHVRHRFGAAKKPCRIRAPPPRFFWRMHHLLKQNQILHPSDTTIAIPGRRHLLKGNTR